MRNPIDVLNSLSDKSKNPEYKFRRLYRNLYNPEFYLLAYKNIYANGGSMTPGADGITVDGMSFSRIDRYYRVAEGLLIPPKTCPPHIYRQEKQSGEKAATWYPIRG